MNQDLEHLKILSVFHYVVAGISAIFACFPIFHLAMGISMITGGFFMDQPAADAPFPTALFGLMFTLIPAAIILFGWAFAVSMAIAGYFLGKQQRYMFCMVMAGISCIFTPFGTVLGVFTLIVLLRPAVRELFNDSAPRPA
ncbi:MAG: hypothetical protein QY332_13725 [Anaerolineales bacterium]|nr:MAG: hypothetical protein QY332_13725 [Anaerolineales bacterium]